MGEKGVAQVGCLGRWVSCKTRQKAPHPPNPVNRKLAIFTDLQSTDPSCPPRKLYKVKGTPCRCYLGTTWHFLKDQDVEVS
jgi:hypothetical protein